MEVYHGSFSIRIVLIVATYRQLIYLTKTNMWNWNMIIKSPNEVWRLIVIAPFLIIIIIILSFFLSSAKSLSDTFLGDYWTEINETSQEC
jgi:hypothetical protein